MKIPTILLVAAAIALASANGAMAAKICKAGSVRGHWTDNVTRGLSRAEAIADWSAVTAVRWSLKYANWSNALDKRVSCSKRTNAIGINYYRCRAAARPCAYK